MWGPACGSGSCIHSVSQGYPPLRSLSSRGHYYREHKTSWPNSPTEMSVKQPCFYLLSILALPSEAGPGQREQHAQAGTFPKRFLDPSENRLLPALRPHNCSRHPDASASGSSDSRDARLSQQGHGSGTAVKGQLCPSSHCTDFLSIPPSVQMSAAKIMQPSLLNGLCPVGGVSGRGVVCPSYTL